MDSVQKPVRYMDRSPEETQAFRDEVVKRLKKYVQCDKNQ
jgi:septum formation topological specificity factor MinE